MAWGMKQLQNLSILVLQNLFPVGKVENSPRSGCVRCRIMLRALLRQRLCAMSWVDGREVPMIFSAVLTTLCSVFGWQETAVLSSFGAGSATAAESI